MKKQKIVSILVLIIILFISPFCYATNPNIVLSNDFNVNTNCNENIVTTVEEFRTIFPQNQYEGNIYNNAESFLNMQKKYNVNAIFAACVTIVESTGGTNWKAIPKSTYNWFSISGGYNGSYVQTNRKWCKYDSFSQAIDHFGELIAESPYYFKKGKNTVSQIAVPFSSVGWGKSVNKLMNERLIKLKEISVNQEKESADDYDKNNQYTIENLSNKYINLGNAPIIENELTESNKKQESEENVEEDFAKITNLSNKSMVSEENNDKKDISNNEINKQVIDKLDNESKNNQEAEKQAIKVEDEEKKIEKDDTVAKGKILPQTGINFIIIPLTILSVIIGVYTFFKIMKCKEI